jgi:hypothetical protein
MKLYTEEQVRKAMIAGMHIGYSNQFNIDNINNDVDKAMKYRTPIELPSDDELENKLRPFNDEYVAGYYAAINMIEEQIKQQDK